MVGKRKKKFSVIAFSEFLFFLIVLSEYSLSLHSSSGCLKIEKWMPFYILYIQKFLSKIFYRMFVPRFINRYLMNSTTEAGMHSSILLCKNCQQDIVANFNAISNIKPVLEGKGKYSESLD